MRRLLLTKFIIILMVVLCPAIQRIVIAQEITLIAGGDIEWSRITKAPGIYYDSKKKVLRENILVRVCRKLKIETSKKDWIPVPYVSSVQSKLFLENKLGRKLENSKSHHISSIRYGLKLNSAKDTVLYPFQKIASVLRKADIAFANLETPLSDQGRYSGQFRTPTSFVEGLKWAGIDVLSTANNHALDAEGIGLVDTKNALQRANIGAVGSGRNLADARLPFIVEKEGLRFAFLSYSQFVDVGSSGFALSDRSGVVPLDPFLIKEDIQRIRDQVNYVVISLHWGVANKQDIHPAARKFAQTIIDAGADIILGHHPHVPRGIEVYKGKAIIYSLGNFIFGHNHKYWMDNYLARITLSFNRIEKIEILPISGQGKSLSQPYLLKGQPAHALIKNIKNYLHSWIQKWSTMEILELLHLKMHIFQRIRNLI